MRVDADVMTVLSVAAVSNHMLTLVGQLDRRLYEKTNKVLEAAGGKWNRKSKAHIFDGDAEDRISQILATGSIDIPKDEFELFPTPAALAAELAREAGVGPGMLCLEPQAGPGALALAMRSLGAEVHCIELMPSSVIKLNELQFQVTHADFLTVEPNPIYDVVLQNPPFSKSKDLAHTRHALGFLKPGGRLLTVLAGGVTFRGDRKATEFRELVAARGGYIRELPQESFKSSGTSVNTVVASIPA